VFPSRKGGANISKEKISVGKIKKGLGMNMLTGVIILLYGIILGSFYNVVIYRLPLEKSIIKGRSHCPACKTRLTAKDLIPVISQLSLKNRCRYCNEKIAIRYPVIELLTGFLFLLSYCKYGFGWEFFRYVFLWSLLLITAIIDYEWMLILDTVLLAFSLFMVSYIMFAGASPEEHLLGAAIGMGVYLVIYLSARCLYKREAFGFGDVLLMGSVGFFLGKTHVVTAVIMPFYMALASIIIMKLLGGKIKRKKEIPFGPYICGAAFVISLFGNQIKDFFRGILF